MPTFTIELTPEQNEQLISRDDHLGLGARISRMEQNYTYQIGYADLAQIEEAIGETVKITHVFYRIPITLRPVHARTVGKIAHDCGMTDNEVINAAVGLYKLHRERKQKGE